MRRSKDWRKLRKLTRVYVSENLSRIVNGYTFFQRLMLTVEIITKKFKRGVNYGGYSYL